MPPGPSSALPAESSPAESAPFPGAAGGAEPAGGAGEPACCHHGEGCVLGKASEPVSEVNKSVNKKQKDMLARVSPAALHLKVQAREQQQLNGLVSSAEDAENRPDNPRQSVEHCDSSSSSSGSNEEAHCQHEGHSAFSKNGRHSPLNMNGMPGFTRTEAAHHHSYNPSGDDDDVKEEFDHLTEPPDTGPGEEEDSQPPADQLARLDLSGSPGKEEDSHGIRYVRYESELQMPWIMRLITKDLSEPYSIYTYRYFIHNWPQLCFLAMVEQECVGAIVCKLDMHKKMFRRGYIAMLAVDSKHRRKSIGTNLVKKAIYAMVEGDCDEVVLETEITNKSALKLYENLGFVRDKRLFRYYLNGVDALRLKLWLR